VPSSRPLQNRLLWIPPARRSQQPIQRADVGPSPAASAARPQPPAQGPAAVRFFQEHIFRGASDGLDPPKKADALKQNRPSSERTPAARLIRAPAEMGGFRFRQVHHRLPLAKRPLSSLRWAGGAG